MKELKLAKTFKPSFDEEFILYRYEKLIQEERIGAEKEDLGGMDMISMLGYQNHLKMYKDMVSESTFGHMEFWSELQEQRPDLMRLLQIGRKINKAIKSLEEHYAYLNKINPNGRIILRIHANFLTQILNDKERGEKLMRSEENPPRHNNQTHNLISYDISQQQQFVLSPFSTKGAACASISGELVSTSIYISI